MTEFCENLLKNQSQVDPKSLKISPKWGPGGILGRLGALLGAQDSLSKYIARRSALRGWWLSYLRPSHTLCMCVMLGAILLVFARVSVHSSACSFCQNLPMRPERLSAHFSFARLFARLFFWPILRVCGVWLKPRVLRVWAFIFAYRNASSASLVASLSACRDVR